MKRHLLSTAICAALLALGCVGPRPVSSGFPPEALRQSPPVGLEARARGPVVFAFYRGPVARGPEGVTAASG